MGRLIGQKIDYVRAYEPNNSSELNPIPDNDYQHILPITVYEAVKRNLETGSTTLDLELASIYRLINDKQNIIPSGENGKLMTWTNTAGQIGSTEIVSYINPEIIERSNKKIPSERAVGAELDLKANRSDLNTHINNLDMHVDEAERERWNEAISQSDFLEHTSDAIHHVSQDEKNLWNNMTPLSTFSNHSNDIHNPHNVTAHQISTYTSSEIDAMFESLRETFFSYKNIAFDINTAEATLVEYDEDNWNPNYILAYGEDINDIDIVDETLTYFALKPATDYATNESPECIIYVKRPGYSWVQVGLETMNPGDLVIRYSDSAMCVWIQGRFNTIFTDSTGTSSSDNISGGSNDQLWYPRINDEGIISWSRNSTNVPPSDVSIKGKDGRTPVKGVDYFDGAPGIGVPVGGDPYQILMKSDDNDYETEWVNVDNVIAEFLSHVDGTLPGLIITWDDITEKPLVLSELGDSETDLVSQKAITEAINDIQSTLNGLNATIGQTGGYSGLASDLSNHISNYSNPHRVTAAQIGAVSIEDFTKHLIGDDPENPDTNPHGTTATDVGLGNVDNTSDEDKPISIATQRALDSLNNEIQLVSDRFDSASLISNISWNNSSCKLIITFKNDEVIEVELPIIDIFNTITYDDINDELVIDLPNNTQHRISVTNLITEYVGTTETHIKTEVIEGNKIKATLIPNSITGDELTESIVLRNSPTTTTQLPSDNSNKIATTKFVKQSTINELNSYAEDRPLSANMGRVLNINKTSVDDVVQIISEIPLTQIADNLNTDASDVALSARMGMELQLDKAPKVHTAASGSIYGRGSVDLFGHVRASDVDPLMDGVAFVGTDDGRYARADHRHPQDVSRAPMHWPDINRGQYAFTGEPRSSYPPDGVYDDRIATTEWVHNNASNNLVEPMSMVDIVRIVNETYNTVVGGG